MCGFFDSFSYKKNANILISNQSLEHRGPDDIQNYKDDYFECVFFRLKILGGNKGAQPMLSDNGRWLILFNGEVYNFIELGEELGLSNCKNYSDTKFILEQFSKFGIKALEKFNGMFAIVLYDRIDKKIFLIRDRLGTKPLYYSLKNQILYFASEIKSIPIKKEVKDNIVNDYLILGKYPRISTFYKDIYNVEPSHIISFNKNNFKKNKYFFLKKKVDIRSKQKIEI